jgi:hypothetical protein
MNWFVVLDGLNGKGYEGSGTPPVFSPDGRHLAYGVKEGREYWIVLDGVEGTHYDDVVSMGGGTIVFDSQDRFHHLALKGDDIYLVDVRLQ